MIRERRRLGEGEKENKSGAPKEGWETAGERAARENTKRDKTSVKGQTEKRRGSLKDADKPAYGSDTYRDEGVAIGIPTGEKKEKKKQTYAPTYRDTNRQRGSEVVQYRQTDMQRQLHEKGKVLQKHRKTYIQKQLYTKHRQIDMHRHYIHSRRGKIQ